MMWYWIVLICIGAVAVWTFLSAVFYKQFFKRFYDVVLSFVALVVLSPLLLILTVVGALNWGSVGLFQFDVVAWISGGSAAVLARIIYTLVALAGLWCLSLIFRPEEWREHDREHT